MAEVASAFVSLVPSMKGFGSKLDSQIGGEVKSSGGRMGKVFSGALKVGAFAATAGIAAVGAAFTGAVKAAAESEKITAATAAVLKSTGGAANVTAKDVSNLGNEISSYSGIADESVREGQNMLLTFTKVRNEVGKGNDVFTQATKLTTDMSVALGTDMKGAALQVGKALNDPTKGVTALSRAGVSFTQQQKDQIKTMQESGDMLGAQKLILSELETQFGGAAKAAGSTFAGSVEKLKNAFGDALRDAVMPLLPALTRFATLAAAHIPGAIAKAVGAVKAIVAALRPFGEVVAQVFRVASDVFSRFRSDSGATQGAIAKSLGGIIAAFKGLAAAVLPIVQQIITHIRKHWGPISAFAKDHFGKVRSIITDVMRVVTRVVQIATKVVSVLWGRFGKDILKIATTVFKAIGGVVSGAMKAIGGVVKLVLSILKGDWSGAWNAIKQIVSGVWQAITSVIKGAWSIIKTVIAAGLRLARDAVSAGFSRIVELVQSLPGRILSALGGMSRLLVSAGADLIRGFISGIRSMASELVSAIASTITDKLPDFVKKRLGISSPSKVFRELGQNTGEGMALGLSDSERLIARSADGLIPRPRLDLADTHAAAGAGGVRITQHFPASTTPEAAAAAAGGRVVADLAAVGI
jgi:phage-related protein